MRGGGRQLVDEEARPIGKLAGTQAVAAKKELDRIRDAAKVRRSKARKKGASAQEIEDIDTKAALDRAAITEALCDIKHMPAADTVIVEPPAPRPPADPVVRIRAIQVMFGSEVAWNDIAAARAVEDAERWLFYDFDDLENTIDHKETRREIELASLHYRHAPILEYIGMHL